MDLERIIELKDDESKRVILGCSDNVGAYAGQSNYKYQYWIRDFFHSQEAVIEAAGSNAARRTIHTFLLRRKPDGTYPVVVRPPKAFLSAIRYPRISYPMHPVFLKSDHPWTNDSEIAMLLSIYEYAGMTGDHSFIDANKGATDKTLETIRGKLNRNGLVMGRGWMDAMFCRRIKPGLSNNILLLKLYKAVGLADEARMLENKINEKFWNGDLGFYSELEGGAHFDTLGNSLALMEMNVDNSRKESIVRAFDKASTKFGMLNVFPHYEKSECGQKAGFYQNGTVWPFGNGYYVLAMLGIGRNDKALEGFARMNRLSGFYEWYDPNTGYGKGCRGLLMSASLWRRAYRALKNSGDIQS